ncbi:hypothetical protein TNCV_2365931 [Trichonephila clavipes]|nr:hypothetical protein TNCV_2365931 [Trichonephila clavipes]
MQEVDERENCGMYFIPHLGVYRSDKKQKAHICICGCAKNVSNDLDEVRSHLQHSVESCGRTIDLIRSKELKNQLINIFAAKESKNRLARIKYQTGCFVNHRQGYNILWSALGPVVAKAENLPSKIMDAKELIGQICFQIQSIENGDNFVESLQVVNDININRCIVVEQPEVIPSCMDSPTRPSQHIGAVVYCKSIISDGKMLVHLIASKSRGCSYQANNDSQT